MLARNKRSHYEKFNCGIVDVVTSGFRRRGVARGSVAVVDGAPYRAKGRSAIDCRAWACCETQVDFRQPFSEISFLVASLLFPIAATRAK